MFLSLPILNNTFKGTISLAFVCLFIYVFVYLFTYLYLFIYLFIYLLTFFFGGGGFELSVDRLCVQTSIRLISQFFKSLGHSVNFSTSIPNLDFLFPYTLVRPHHRPITLEHAKQKLQIVPHGCFMMTWTNILIINHPSPWPFQTCIFYMQ